MKKSTKNAPKKNDQNVTDLTPKKDQDVNGGYVSRMGKHSPLLNI